MNSILSTTSEKAAGGLFIASGAATGAASFLAGKSIIAIGILSHVIPIIGTIMGVAMMILGSCLLYHAWQRERADSELPLLKRVPQGVQKTDIPEETEKKQLLEDLSIAVKQLEPGLQEKSETLAASTATQDPLALTDSDKLMTASNLVQWGLIGASVYGVAPTIIMPLSILSSFSSEVASFCMLPKDASWLRKAMSIPLLSKAIINYNPWVARIFQATSLYNLVQSSATKLKNVWNAFQSNPWGAVKSGFIHSFNLASGVAFTSGLAQPRPNPQSRIIIKRPLNSYGTEPQTHSTDCPPAALANLPCDMCGMFSVEHYLIGVFDQFEKGRYSGVKVDFGDAKPYYDPSRGPNWFQYYFCPVDIVDKNCLNAPQKSFSLREYGNLCNYVDNTYAFENSGLSSERTRELIQKYLILKPEIQGEADQFAKTHFSESDYVVGVHYRGTDKACNNGTCEARRVTYEEMTSNIQDHIGELKLEDQKAVKIFVASDEEKFVEHLEKNFPNQVVASPAKRSIDGKPIHLNASDPYQSGKEALIDSWLLAKLSNVLIRTSSNLSRISEILLRKGAKAINVSKRFYQTPAVNARP